jgi:proteasome lid subunit RPN8/RPN11
MLVLTSDIIAAMEQHAREEHPRECCGMLAGKDTVITLIFKTKNIDPGEDKYAIDPIEQLQAFEQIDRLSLHLLGVYHSHPHHPCYPSAIDISRAFYPDIAFFIISLQDLYNPQIKAFTIEDGRVAEEEIVVR